MCCFINFGCQKFAKMACFPCFGLLLSYVPLSDAFVEENSRADGDVE